MDKPSPTRPEDHLWFLDQIRGVAIFMVFAFHCTVVAFLPVLGISELDWNGWFRDLHVPPSFLLLLPLTLGWIGVPIFFVVSGFCIHLSHARSRAKDWRTFFTRRFFRIYPPYLASLLFFALVFPGTALHFTSTILHHHAEWFYSTIQLGVHLLLIHNFSPISLKGINPPFWSIAVEVQLYLLYPLIYRLLATKGALYTLWITGTVEIGLRAIHGLLFILFPTLVIPTWFAYQPFMFWFSWTIGAVLAEAYLTGEPLPFRHTLTIWPILMLVCYDIKPLSVFCFTLAALTTASAIATLLKREAPAGPIGSSLLARHFRFTGSVSYSAYLIHMPLLYLVPAALSFYFNTSSPSPLVVASFCLIAWLPILGISWLVYKIIELPSIGLGKYFIRLISGVSN